MFAESPFSPRGDDAASLPHTDLSNQREVTFRSNDYIDSVSEETPLLQCGDAGRSSYRGESRSRSRSCSSSIESIQTTSPKSRQRWPTLIALAFLTTAVFLTLFFGFAAPSGIEAYSRQAAQIRFQNASVVSATSSELQVRIHADFALDGSQVHSKSLRDFGRLATWIAREVETEQTELYVRLPEYGDEIVGTAIIPSIKLNIRSGAANHINIVIHLIPGDVTSIPLVVNDWFDGRLAYLKLHGAASIGIRSGLLRLSSQKISENILIDGRITLRC
jgi:hypothetical protein